MCAINRMLIPTGDIERDYPSDCCKQDLVEAWLSDPHLKQLLSLERGQSSLVVFMEIGMINLDFSSFANLLLVIKRNFKMCSFLTTSAYFATL